MIVCDDADLERATQAANFGAFMHQGQICMSIERLIVSEKIYDKFVDKFLPRVKKLKVGPTDDKANVLGPVINDRAADRLRRHFDDARSKGAKILAGGEIDGRFVSPTVFANVTPDMLLYQEESFGPVCSIFKARNDEDAIRIANDSEYGLTAGVFTDDEERGLGIINRLETGNCHLNCSPVNDEPHVPFGGVKGSGSGKHGGRWSMETFTETRWITLERGGRLYPPVF
jgi:aldehyde dehydrogenase (NAD+)